MWKDDKTSYKCYLSNLLFHRFSGSLMSYLVSVIIPSFNRQHDLCRCINSLFEQEYDPIEIIVVDDCSDDDTVNYVNSNYSNVNVISTDRRYGPSYLRNVGLREAKGKFILFLDSDVILPNRDVISRMVERLSQDESIGEIGGEIPVYLGIEDEARGKRRDFLGRNHDVVSKRNDGVSGDGKECTYLATCNCMVRKDVVFEVGGFDPYYKFGGEDADFGYAILKRGYTNWVDFETGVLHGRSAVGRYPDETYRYHLTRVRFNLKHLSVMRNLIIFLIDFLSFLIFYFLLLPKMLVKKIGNDELVPENYLGGYYLMRAYKVNLAKYSELKSLKDTNFLRKEEMDRFESRVASDIS